MGLIASIYRDARGGDCTNGGVSGRDRGAVGLCLVNVDGPFKPCDEYPPAMLVEHLPFGPDKGRRLCRVVPCEQDAGGEWRPSPGWMMFGGNYCATSDSRFGEHVRELLQLDPHEFHTGAIPIHDRTE